MHVQTTIKPPHRLLKTQCTLLLKCLAAFCVLGGVGAAPADPPPSPPGLADHSAPRYIKPQHTVWHEGTELEKHVIVKLINDDDVLNKRRHAALSIGGLKLKAAPVFPTHRRRKLQATGEPSDPLHLFFELDAPDGNGAALCDILNNDTNVEVA